MTDWSSCFQDKQDVNMKLKTLLFKFFALEVIHFSLAPRENVL